MTAHQYLKNVRSMSNYPAFRGVAALVLWVFYIAGALLALGGMLASSSGMTTAAVAIGVGALIALVGKVAHEAMLMLADLADATIDRNARDVEETVES